jgi:hypothetical protein
MIQRMATEPVEGTFVAGPVTMTIEDRQGRGPSIRVLGTEDGHEYLRFDMFYEGPHYHYEPLAVGGEPCTERRLLVDPVAEGDPVAWAMRTLRARLDPMLREAGAHEQATQLQAEVVARALDDIDALVHAIREQRGSALL